MSDDDKSRELDELLSVPVVDEMAEVLEEDVKDVPEPAGSSWTPTALGDIVRGVADGSLVRPTPTLCRIDGLATGLFYPGKVHDVHGVAGGGKSYLMAYAAAQELDAHHHVSWVDLEDNPDTLVRRLIDLGVSEADIVEYLHYTRPTEPSQAGIAYLHATLADFPHTMVVIDSTGESMGMDGVKANEDSEVAAWLRRVTRTTADLGPAVVLIDHVPKASEEALMSIGSQRKSAGMDGAIWSVQGVKGMSFSRTKSGFVNIVCGKDRTGDYPKGETIAQFHFDADRKEFSLRDYNPAPAGDGGFRPTVLMERVARYVELNPGATGKAITDNVRGRRDAVLRAVEVLIDEGYVSAAARTGRGGGQEYTCLKPFLDATTLPPGPVMPEQEELEGLLPT